MASSTNRSRLKTGMRTVTRGLMSLGLYSAFNPHRLDIDELAGAMGAELATEAGVLDSAEGHAGVGGDHGVDEDLAGLDAVDEAIHFGAIVRPDGCAEAEGRVVRDGDGL